MALLNRVLECACPGRTSHIPIWSSLNLNPGNDSMHVMHVGELSSGVNCQASQFSPPVTLQQDAAVVPHSCAAVWQFSHLYSLWPDAAVVNHSCAVVWKLFHQDSVRPDAAVVLYSCASVWQLSSAVTDNALLALSLSLLLASLASFLSFVSSLLLALSFSFLLSSLAFFSPTPSDSPGRFLLFADSITYCIAMLAIVKLLSSLFIF